MSRLCVANCSRRQLLRHVKSKQTCFDALVRLDRDHVVDEQFSGYRNRLPGSSKKRLRDTNPTVERLELDVSIISDTLDDLNICLHPLQFVICQACRIGIPPKTNTLTSHLRLHNHCIDQKLKESIEADLSALHLPDPADDRFRRCNGSKPVPGISIVQAYHCINEGCDSLFGIVFFPV